MKKYAIGLDFGTNSCRSLIVDLEDGREIAQKTMTGIREVFEPDMVNYKVYQELYRLYVQLHDAF